MALITKASIQEVSDRLDAVSIIGEYVRLEKKSNRFWGRCPFHGGGQEKTPSFKVDPDTKMFYCFGCGKGGSVISFVMEMEKLTYPEAIKNIARKISVELVYEEGGSENVIDSSAKEQLYELYKRTTVTFTYFLREKDEGQAALKYIKDRGISEEMIDQFRLGFAPNNRDFLYKFLQQKGYSSEFLEKSGLFSSKYKTLPLFSGRLMFPITDRQGRIVAFGGRSMPGVLQSDGSEPPKYINSPETEIYKKGQTLFAIEQAKTLMRKEKTVFLAEGYMDVIALHQAGITNAVAPLGTAFTDEQALWLRRWVETVVLILDNDEAGQKATYKAILTCRKNGLICLLADLKTGFESQSIAENPEKLKDPAEILQKFGPQILKNILKFTINDFEYLINCGRNQFIIPKGDINGALEFMFAYLEALSSEADRSDILSRIADIFRIERNAVVKDFSVWKKNNFRASNEKPLKDEPELSVHYNDELLLLANVALNMELYPEFRAAVEIKEIEDRAAKEIFIALEESFKYDESGIDSILDRIKDDKLRSFITDRGTTGEFKKEPQKFMEDGIKKIKKKKLEKRLTEITALLRESERAADESVGIDDLLGEKIMLDSEIRKLKDNN